MLVHKFVSMGKPRRSAEGESRGCLRDSSKVEQRQFRARSTIVGPPLRARVDESAKLLASANKRPWAPLHGEEASIVYITSHTAPPTTTASISTVRMPAPARSAVVIGVRLAVGSVGAWDPAFGSLFEVAPVRRDNGIRA